jgi:hypothetical protein
MALSLGEWWRSSLCRYDGGLRVAVTLSGTARVSFAVRVNPGSSSCCSNHHRAFRPDPVGDPLGAITRVARSACRTACRSRNSTRSRPAYAVARFRTAVPKDRTSPPRSRAPRSGGQGFRVTARPRSSTRPTAGAWPTPIAARGVGSRVRARGQLPATLLERRDSSAASRRRRSPPATPAATGRASSSGSRRRRAEARLHLGRPGCLRRTGHPRRGRVRADQIEAARTPTSASSNRAPTWSRPDGRPAAVTPCPGSRHHYGSTHGRASGSPSGPETHASGWCEAERRSRPPRVSSATGRNGLRTATP